MIKLVKGDDVRVTNDDVVMRAFVNNGYTVAPTEAPQAEAEEKPKATKRKTTKQ